MSIFTHVLVATDFGEASSRAVELAIALAPSFDARLTVMHVTELSVFVPGGEGFVPYDFAPIEAAGRLQLEETLVEIRKSVPSATAEYRTGDAAEEILGAISNTGADLVIVGTHGRRGVRRLLLGSVAEKVVRLSPVPVLTVPGLRDSGAEVTKKASAPT